MSERSGILRSMRTLLRTTTNPAFYADQLRLELGEAPARLQRALADADSVDLLTWNVFASLDTHRDREYLGYRLQALGGASVRSPVRMALWTGRDREPRLSPPPGYVATVHERARAAGGTTESLDAFAAPVEVPVRIETPDVLVLVDTMLDHYPVGGGGRDRVTELVDVGLDHARRLGKTLAVAVVYDSGTEAAARVSARMQQLRDPAVLAAELPHRPRVPQVILREVGWQQLVKVWDAEAPHLELGGQPVGRFRRYLGDLGLR